MAQTGYTPIQLYRSATASAAPVAGNLADGELALNTNDGKLFYKDSGGAVQVIGWKTVPVSAGGTGVTTLTGIVKGNGTGNFSAATAGTDYQAAITATGILKGAGSGSVSAATAGTDYVAASGTGALVTGLKETKVAMAANDINISSGNYFTKTISTTTTLTVSNVPTTGTVAAFVLELTNGGSATITYPTGSKWAGGSAPILTSSGKDILGAYTHDAGTTWNWLVLGKDVK